MLTFSLYSHIKLEKMINIEIKNEITSYKESLQKNTQEFSGIILATLATLGNSVDKTNMKTKILQEELQKKSSELEEITDKFNELKKEHYLVLEKCTNQEEVHQEELLNIQKILNISTIDRKALDNQNEELRLQLNIHKEKSSDIETLREQIVSLRRHNDEVQSERVACENLLTNEINQKTQLQMKNNELVEKIRVLTDQQERLFNENSILQENMSSLIAKEQSLRQELGSHTNDKSDMSKQLRQIKEKVKHLEEENAIEVKGLKAELDALRLEKHEALLGSNQQAIINNELTNNIKYLQSQVEQQKEKYSKEMEQLRSSHDLERSKNEKLTNENDSYKGKTALQLQELQNDNNNLRNDLVDATSRSNALKDQVKALEATISKLNSTISSKDALINSKENESNVRNNQQVLSLTTSLESTQQLLKDKLEEIDHLKDCVRRECEERTEMLIEISELKDQLNKYSNSNRKINMETVTTASVSSKSNSIIRNDIPDTEIQPFLKSVPSTSSSKSFGALIGDDDDTNFNHPESADAETYNSWANSNKQRAIKAQQKKRK